MFLLACSPESPAPSVDADGKPAYITLDQDHSQLRADFNAMADKVRLVFISGPSCGICLRGMDDLNESIVASLQNDPRTRTFVVYVPTLGAEEKHVAAAVPLMQGPRIKHYWDEEGNSGLEFQKALGIPMYAWDVWMMYEPGLRWESGSAPPAPVFWQHQLPGLPENQMLVYLKQALSSHRRLAEESGRSLTRDDLSKAVVDGALMRVRPIMMTVAAIIAGLLPIMLGSGTGSEVMRRIAAPMVGGMVSATILTLAVIPATFLIWQTHRLKKIVQA